MTSFDARLEQLARELAGDLEVKVTYDQVYAAPQERGFWETGPNAGVQIRNHPRGGGSHFLRDAVITHTDEYMAELARETLTPSGSNQRSAAERVGHLIDDRAAAAAPVEFVNLRRSGHITVSEGGQTVYDRAPDVPRLTGDQLRTQRLNPSTDYGPRHRPRP